MTKKRFQVKGMHCVGCALTIDDTLEQLAGVKSAMTQYARQAVEVEYDPEKISEVELIAAVEKAGYRIETK